jgi:hypothetical protein
MPSLHVSPASHTSRHAQNATATHVPAGSQASSPRQSSCVRHGVPLPPSSAKGVHVGTASPLTPGGHAASAPAQNGAHTDAPGNWIGAVSFGHAPLPSGAGYDGSSGAPVVDSSAPSLLSLAALVVVSAPLELPPPSDDVSLDESSVPVDPSVPSLSAAPSSSGSSSPPHATTQVADAIAHQTRHAPIRMSRTPVTIAAGPRPHQSSMRASSLA